MDALQAALSPTSSSLGWRRDSFEIALIGPEAMRHKDLLLRAGYGVRGAAQGDKAQLVFADDRAVDLIVLDFALEGRPPEAVLLFSRRTSASALLVALVPAQDSEAFRRAFMAGARDVLPTPSRSEDLLASIDYLLEPRALLSVVERLRSQLGSDETTAHPPSKSDEGRVIALEAQLAELRREIERLRDKHKDELTHQREQALDAVSERDRASLGRDALKKQLSAMRRQAREGSGQLRLLERACEELQRKLRDSRDGRRRVESKLADTERRLIALEEAMRRHVRAAEEELREEVDVILLDGKEPLDPEDALSARAEDERRLSELETTLRERDALERRVRELEEELARAVLPVLPTRDAERTRADAAPPSDPEAALSARADDEKRLAELDCALVERDRLDGEVRRLRDALDDGGSESTRSLTRELIDLKDAQTELAALLEAVRLERDSAKRRVAELEREAADALMRVEELTPLVAEVERLKNELRGEREAHGEARKNAWHVTTQFSQLDRATATMMEEIDVKQRALALAYARNEVLAAEVANLRARTAGADRAQAEAVEQLREAEGELDVLRKTIARLAAERHARLD